MCWATLITFRSIITAPIFKFRNGWLLNANLHTVTASGTYRIYAQDFGGNLRPARKYGIRIPVSITAGGETMDYWLDFRPDTP
jgi:hypothetical protein